MNKELDTPGTNRNNSRPLTFTTNINCGGCIARVKPFLDGEKTITGWEVDLHSKNKKLTVVGEDANENRIIKLVTNAGFKIQPDPSTDNKV